MTRSMDDPRCTDGPALVAVRTLPGQARPLLITTLRPLAVVACEALQEADRLLTAQGARLAVIPAHGVGVHNAPLLQK